MEILRKFLFTLFAWGLFALGGMTFFHHEMRFAVDSKKPASGSVVSAPYVSTADLTQMPGEQIIGMVPFALDGDFTLIIDGVSINSATDISTVNLSGAVGRTYRIEISRDSAGGIISITATH